MGFEKTGFTAKQERAIAKDPNLKAAFRGDRIDKFFKEAVRDDPMLRHLEVTPRGKFGPDVFDPETQKWWDVTTSKQWDKHTEKYWLFGDGTALLTDR